MQCHNYIYNLVMQIHFKLRQSEMVKNKTYKVVYQPWSDVFKPMTNPSCWRTVFIFWYKHSAKMLKNEFIFWCRFQMIFMQIYRIHSVQASCKFVLIYSARL